MVIDTLRASANKYKYDERLGIFRIDQEAPT